MLIGYEVSFWDDENVLELDRHGTTLSVLKATTESYNFKWFKW